MASASGADQVRRPGAAAGACRPMHSGQAAAVHELQREVRPALAARRPRRSARCWGAAAGRRPRPRSGSGPVCSALACAAGQDHLERDQPVEADLPGLVDDAHAAAPQFAQDLVAGRSGRRHRGRQRGWSGGPVGRGRHGGRCRRSCARGEQHRLRQGGVVLVHRRGRRAWVSVRWPGRSLPGKRGG